MITVRLWGGLGNQLFQYSFGKYIEYWTSKKVFFDTASFGTSDQLRELEICSLTSDILLNNVSFTQYTGIKNRLFRGLFQCSNTFIPEDKFCLDFLGRARGNIFLQGYWQDEKYAKSFPRSRILKEWRTPDVLQEYVSIISKTEIPISLHIRRGDYFSPKNIGIYGVCTKAYYRKAIDYVLSTIKGNKKIFVFSDDMSWVKENITLPDHTIFVPNYKVLQFSYIYLMSLCKINIVSNSTFSWWGAYLNQYPNKIIIAPSRWTLNTEKTLALDSWIKLKI